MGIYVYALNTKVQEISGVTLGTAEYRYKESWSDDVRNERLYNRMCKRRVEHFENNKLPFFFVMHSIDSKKFYEGQNVYSMQNKRGRAIGACFDDGVEKIVVGTMTKVGRSWTINWK